MNPRIALSGVSGGKQFTTYKDPTLQSGAWELEIKSNKKKESQPDLKREESEIVGIRKPEERFHEKEVAVSEGIIPGILENTPRDLPAFLMPLTTVSKFR